MMLGNHFQKSYFYTKTLSTYGIYISMLDFLDFLGIRLCRFVFVMLDWKSYQNNKRLLLLIVFIDV